MKRQERQGSLGPYEKAGKTKEVGSVVDKLMSAL